MTAIASRLENAIGSLRERFLQGLPARLDAIYTALQSPAARAVERGFHNLTGTAATYGLFGIAAVAAEGERICDQAGDILDDATRVQLTILVDHLRTVAETWQRRVAC
jgi:HPt (histidine-containing phosphotransfer) domain-containing protein